MFPLFWFIFLPQQTSKNGMIKLHHGLESYKSMWMDLKCGSVKYLFL